MRRRGFLAAMGALGALGVERIGGRLLDAGGAVRSVLHPDFAGGARSDGEPADAQFRAAIAALSDGDVLVVPAGQTFSLAEELSVTRAIRITGGGTLQRHRDATDSRCVLHLAADGSSADHLTIDGNQAQARKNGSRGEGVRISASGNRLAHCTVRDTSVSPTGNAVFVASTAQDALVVGVTTSRGGYAGFRNDGNRSVFRQISALDYHFKGFVHNGSADALTIDGFIARSPNMAYSGDAGREALLLDAGGGDILKSALLRGLDLDVNTVGNVAKFACVERLELYDSIISHTSALTTVRFAENMGSARMRGCVIGGMVQCGSAMDELLLEDCLIGDGRSPTVMRSIAPNFLRRLRLHRCEVRRFREAVVREVRPDAAIQRRELIGCTLVGESDGTVYVETRAPGAGVTSSGKLVYLDCSIANAGAGGAALSPHSGALPLFASSDRTAG